jgi:hypothetical protein
MGQVGTSEATMAEIPKFENASDQARAYQRDEALTALEDAKAFNKGKGKTLFGMLAMLALALAAFAWYLVQDQPNPYGELGKQVNGLRGQFFDGYWTCALPGKRLGEIKNDQDLRTELDTRAVAKERYAQHLSNKCRPQVAELIVRLRALLPPEEARKNIQSMIDGLIKVDGGSAQFAEYLTGLEGPYAAEAGAPAMSGLVRGWYEFRKAHAALNQLVRDKLER